MEYKYKITNICDFLSDQILTQEVEKTVSRFSSPQNEDVESFLKNNAIAFTKKGQSVTYLVSRTLDDGKNEVLVGYFALAIKTISINSNNQNLSKTFYKRINRICNVNEDGLYIFPAYLIAQLGKNYALEKDRQISGNELLEIALDVVSAIKQKIGGVVVFLECKDSKNDFLKNFYKNNGFVLFGERTSEKDKKLYQMIKQI